MLFSPNIIDKLQEEDREFFELVLSAMRVGDEELLGDYKASGLYEPDKFQKIYDEAQRVISYEKEVKKQDGFNFFEVEKTYPAIEIENLCRNFADSREDKSDGKEVSGRLKKNEKIPFGFLVFWMFIIPKVEMVAKTVGCEYVYIFAADQTAKRESSVMVPNLFGEECDEEENENGSSDQFALISHYRTNFGFHDADDLFFIRPSYDRKCYGMVQSIKEAMSNKQDIWEQFGDVLEKTEDIESIIP